MGAAADQYITDRFRHLGKCHNIIMMFPVHKSIFQTTDK